MQSLEDLAIEKKRLSSSDKHVIFGPIERQLFNESLFTDSFAISCNL